MTEHTKNETRIAEARRTWRDWLESLSISDIDAHEICERRFARLEAAVARLERAEAARGGASGAEDSGGR